LKDKNIDCFKCQYKHKTAFYNKDGSFICNNIKSRRYGNWYTDLYTRHINCIDGKAEMLIVRIFKKIMHEIRREIEFHVTMAVLISIEILLLIFMKANNMPFSPSAYCITGMSIGVYIACLIIPRIWR